MKWPVPICDPFGHVFAPWVGSFSLAVPQAGNLFLGAPPRPGGLPGRIRPNGPPFPCLRTMLSMGAPLDAWLSDPAIRFCHRRESSASPDALWAAAREVRLRDAGLLGRLVRWRIPG